jgi:hypothetical protein
VTTSQCTNLISSLMLSRTLSTLSSSLAYIVLVLITACLLCLSCILLLAQAVRTSRDRTFVNNWNAVIIGVSYAIVVSIFHLCVVLVFTSFTVGGVCCVLFEAPDRGTSQTAEDIEALQNAGKG